MQRPADSGPKLRRDVALAAVVILTLVDRDGRIWKINAWIPPGESPPRPRTLVINGRTRVRE